MYRDAVRWAGGGATLDRAGAIDWKDQVCLVEWAEPFMAQLRQLHLEGGRRGGHLRGPRRVAGLPGAGRGTRRGL
eukprot:408357-Alexandrium_andersonii.AAC.1